MEKVSRYEAWRINNVSHPLPVYIKNKQYINLNRYTKSLLPNTRLITVIEDIADQSKFEQCSTCSGVTDCYFKHKPSRRIYKRDCDNKITCMFCAATNTGMAYNSKTDNQISTICLDCKCVLIWLIP
jgi:hypothetical protein